MKRNLGDKGVFISDSHIRQIAELYTDFEETEHSKIYPNDFFGYTKVTVERPLMEKSEILGRRTGRLLSGTGEAIRSLILLCEIMSGFPLTDDIDDYDRREIKPYLPDSWIDRKKDKIGYEIKFNRYFYQYTSVALTEGNCR